MKKSVKIISLVLCILIIVSSFSFAFASEDGGNQYVQIKNATVYPNVFIRGNGNKIWNADGTEAYTFTRMGAALSDSSNSKDNIKESVMNVLKPFLIQGALTNNWQPYYDALQKEVGELFDDAILDENGNAQYGTGISQDDKNENNYKMHTNLAGADGLYDVSSERYTYWYDWRLDPFEIVDGLHEYIENIKKATGKDKVNIISNCLGTEIALTYVSKYGTDGIKGMAFEAGTFNGCAFEGEMVSGKFKFDPAAIDRYLQCQENNSDIEALDEWRELIDASLDVLEDSGVFKSGKVSKSYIYHKLGEGVTSALALSTSFTFPSYWDSMSSRDYENAKNYVFGPQGSEKRQKYAGLIAKIDNYDVNVRQKVPELLKKIASSANIAIRVNYGYQTMPMCVSANELGDELVLVKDGSLGATTSQMETVLPDDYIQTRISEGKGKYISPDKQIDASTCLFPDETWFFKNLSHYDWPHDVTKLMATVIDADKQLTVDDFDVSQFVMYDEKTEKYTKMTEDNCDVCLWEKKNNNLNFFQKIKRFFESLNKFFKVLFKYLKEFNKK